MRMEEINNNPTVYYVYHKNNGWTGWEVATAALISAIIAVLGYKLLDKKLNPTPVIPAENALLTKKITFFKMENKFNISLFSDTSKFMSNGIGEIPLTLIGLYGCDILSCLF